MRFSKPPKTFRTQKPICDFNNFERPLPLPRWVTIAPKPIGKKPRVDNGCEKYVSLPSGRTENSSRVLRNEPLATKMV